MRARILTALVSVVLSATCFGRIGENEKQIEARYGKPGKDMGTHGNVHAVGYMSDGFMILVDFVNGISQREGFANPDTSTMTPDVVERILVMNAIEGTKWHEEQAQAGDRIWRRSDNKVIAVFPTRGTFLFVQDVNFVQPKE